MLRKYVFGARFYVSDMFKCGSCGYATRIRVLGDTCTCPRCGATMRRHDAAPVIRREKRCGSFLQSSLEMCRLRDNGFDDEYAQAASLLGAWFQERNTNSPSESNVKNTAYCAVIAAVLDRDYADRLSEFAIRQSEFDAWAVDARNYNFHLPC